MTKIVDFLKSIYGIFCLGACLGNTYFYNGRTSEMKKILVVQQKMIGDVLLSSILCEFLKKKDPSTEIHYCIYDSTYPVVANNPYVDHFVLFSPEHRTNKLRFRKFLKKIHQTKYDMVIDAYGKLESNFISIYSGAEERISYDKKLAHLFYTKTVKRSPKVYTDAGNAVEDRLRLVVAEEEIKDHIIKPKIYLTDEEKQKAKETLQKAGINFEKPIIMIGLLGSADNKSLPDSYMAHLINEVASYTKGQLLFNYMPSQQLEAEAIFKILTPQTMQQCFFKVYGKGLRAFLGLLSQCDMLIGNEGGAVNMAKALDIPTFTIFSPWIHKRAWNMFEDGKKHISVHLSDFEPEVYEKYKIKEIKKSYNEWYKRLTPSKWLPFLEKFLDANVKGQ